MHVLILLLTLISCTPLSPNTKNFDRVSNKAAYLVEKKIPLFCNGIGRMNKDGKISAIHLSFTSENPMTVQEARSILLYSIKISLESIQQDQPIREYLLDESFSINNLIISIYTNSFTRFETPPELVTSLLISRGVIFYDRFDLQTKKFVTIYEETYEEALLKCESAL